MLALVCTGLNPLKLPALYAVEQGRRGLRASPASSRDLHCKLLNVCARCPQSCSVMHHKLQTLCTVRSSAQQQPFPGVARVQTVGKKLPAAGSVLFPRNTSLPKVRGEQFRANPCCLFTASISTDTALCFRPRYVLACSSKRTTCELFHQRCQSLCFTQSRKSPQDNVMISLDKNGVHRTLVRFVKSDP